MWLPFFILLFAFKSSRADIPDDLKHCMTNVNLADLETFDFFPDVDRLDTLCPSIQDFVICLEDVIELNSGFTLEELEAIMEGTDEARYVTVLINMRRTLHELCDGDSQLNKDYRANAQCLTRFKRPIRTGRCFDIGRTIFATYIKVENKVEDVAEDTDQDNVACMMEAYDAVCSGIEIYDKCGEQAFHTYMKIVKGTSFIRHGVCNEKELEKARSKFLDSLEMENTERELYKLAFDLKKKRK